MAIIPWSNPKLSYLSHRAEIDCAIQRVLEKGVFILGEECFSFEKEFSWWLGMGHCIGVANGTDAIRIALLALGVRPGDEVITVCNTAVATVAAIESIGAQPVLVDCDAQFLEIDPAQVEKKITNQTKAIVGVHLYGNCFDLEKILMLCKKYQIKLIEDCAQAHGAEFQGKKIGTWGDISCFSFYPTKNLGALGDGGAIVTSQGDLAQECRQIREYGWKEKFISERKGLNSRLDEIQAAILRVKLKYLDQKNERRRTIAKKYIEELKYLDLDLPTEREGSKHVYHLFVIQSSYRDELQRFLFQSEIQTAIHYPIPIHQQKAYSEMRNLSFPKAEVASKKILSLPIFPELFDSEQEKVLDCIKNFYEENMSYFGKQEKKWI